MSFVGDKPSAWILWLPCEGRICVMRGEVGGLLGSSLGQAGMRGGPESWQLGRAQKNKRRRGWADSRVSWVSVHSE
jgi:hypothetical protein